MPRTGSGLSDSLCFKERSELHAKARTHKHTCVHTRTKQTGTHEADGHTQALLEAPVLAPESALSLDTEKSLELLLTC